jgi:hypothetical protein
MTGERSRSWSNQNDILAATYELWAANFEKVLLIAADSLDAVKRSLLDTVHHKILKVQL